MGVAELVEALDPLPQKTEVYFELMPGVVLVPVFVKEAAEDGDAESPDIVLLLVESGSALRGEQTGHGLRTERQAVVAVLAFSVEAGFEVRNVAGVDQLEFKRTVLVDLSVGVFLLDHEDVLRLDVAMGHVPLLEGGHAFDEVVHELPGDFFRDLT